MTNTETWGNIELPGLSDEVLFKKNWTRVAIALESIKGREANGWAEKNQRRRIDDPNYDKRVGESIKKTFDSKPPEFFIEQGLKISKTKLENPHPTRGKKLPKEWTDAMSKSLKGHVKKDTSKMGKTKKKPLMTPDGPFDSTKSATEHFGYKWAENCAHKIKKCHPGWYWISVEEYILLTGKEI